MTINDAFSVMLAGRRTGVSVSSSLSRLGRGDSRLTLRFGIIIEGRRCSWRVSGGGSEEESFKDGEGGIDAERGPTGESGQDRAGDGGSGIVRGSVEGSNRRGSVVASGFENETVREARTDAGGDILPNTSKEFDRL